MTPAAAHDAGFADSAHLSRMFRRMFGIAPSVVSGDVRRFLRRLASTLMAAHPQL